MPGGECHTMIGLCEVNLGGCHEGERSEPMPALTLGQGVEQNFRRVIRNSTNDKIGILSHEGNGHGNPTWRHEHAKKSARTKWAMWELKNGCACIHARTLPMPAQSSGCVYATVLEWVFGPGATSVLLDHVSPCWYQGRSPRGRI